MRWLLAVALAGCTINGTPRAVARDPDQMSSETLDHEDPSVDTSKHPITSVTSAGPSWFSGCGQLGPSRGGEYYKGCKGCAADGLPDAGGLAVIGAVILAVRRRRT